MACLMRSIGMVWECFLQMMGLSMMASGLMINKDGFGKIAKISTHSVIDIDFQNFDPASASHYEYYEGRFSNNKRDGEGKLINRKGEVFVGEWKNNKPEKGINRVKVMSKQEHQKFIANFMKMKSNRQPVVRILE